MRTMLVASSAAKLFRVLLLLAAQRAAQAEEETVRGPEAKDVVARVSGYVVRTRKGEEILALALPTLKERVVHRITEGRAEPYPTLHAVSGPDDKGRIA